MSSRRARFGLLRAGAAQLEREHRHRRAAGFGGRWLDGRRLSMATGIHAAAAIRTRGNAQVDPYEACAGFMHAAACPTSGPHRRYPRHLFALGYGGNGMTFGFSPRDCCSTGI
ncbi:MAG TPA: hypothetical protein VGQ16_04480 [Vicinamibacterales bacterium]|nr:hypothetical protein [Vicinamibacterales bacterium]